MFGPNSAVHRFEGVSDTSHRSETVRQTIGVIIDRLRADFGLEDYEIALIPGPATLGMEVLIASCLDRIKVIGPKGRFTLRWERAVDFHQSHRMFGHQVPLFCRLETSCSTFASCTPRDAIVDAVSSFPYVNDLGGSIAFVTSPNKLLGGLPGFSIVGVHRDHLGLFDGDDESILSFSRHLSATAQGSVAHTVNPDALYSLTKSLLFLDVHEMRSRVDRICFRFHEAMADADFIGAERCPVLTFTEGAIPEKLVKEYGLYRSGGRVQVFTYSEPEERYLHLIEAIKNARAAE